jgi:hypothetical protein
MKETTITLTDVQMDRLEEEARRLGLPTAVLIRLAVDTFLDLNGAISADESCETGDQRSQADASGAEESAPRLWFVGLGASGYADTSERLEELIAEQWGDWMLFGDDPPNRRSSEPDRSPDATEAPCTDTRPNER